MSVLDQLAREIRKGHSVWSDRHPHADAFHHLADQVTSGTLAGHLRHQAEPSKYPRPSAPITAPNILELTQALNTVASELSAPKPVATPSGLPPELRPEGPRVASTTFRTPQQEERVQGADFGSLNPVEKLIRDASLAYGKGALTAAPYIAAAEAPELLGGVAGGLGTALEASGPGRALLTGARFAGRHPFIASAGADVGAQVPGAIAAGDPRVLEKGLSGAGVLANVLSSAGGAVQKAVPGVLGNALADVISLPSSIPATAYLTGKAGVEAATGNPEDLQALGHQLAATDPIYALVTGHPGEALSRAGEHPVYALLEALGVKSLAGHAGGLAGRTGALGDEIKADLTTTRRPPRSYTGNIVEERGPMSRDLIQNRIQKALDVRAIRKRPGPQVPAVRVGARAAREGETTSSIRGTDNQFRRYLLGAPGVGGGLVDRIVYAGRAAQKRATGQAAEALQEATPKDTAQANVASLAAQPLIRPESMVADLRDFRDQIVAHQEGMTPGQLLGSRNLVDTIDSALKNPDPAAVEHLAQTFISLHEPYVAELIRSGFYEQAQTERAQMTPFVRRELGGAHGLNSADAARVEEIAARRRTPGLPKAEHDKLFGELQKLRSRTGHIVPDGEGDWRSISNEEIAAEMQKRGYGEQTGFLTHRPGAPKGMRASWRTMAERPRVGSARRTGEAVWSHDPSHEALLGQLQSTISTVMANRGFTHFVSEVGTDVPGVHSMRDAYHFMQEPRDFAQHSPEGVTVPKLPKVDGGWVPIRKTPWPQVGREVEAALHEQNPSVAQQVLGAEEPQAVADSLMESAIRNAADKRTGPNGEIDNTPTEITFVPKLAFDRYQAHYAQIGQGWRAMQASAGIFKGAVLPTSPSWLTGNAVDNYLVRMLGTGLSPRSIKPGGRFADTIVEQLGPDSGVRAREGIASGALYASMKTMQPFRGAEQFVSGRLGNIARAGHALLEAPVARNLHGYLKAYQHAVFDFDHRFIEQYPQYAALSEVARRDLNMTRGQWRKAVANQDQAVLDLAKGLRNTGEQVRYAKRVEATFGNWTKMSPGARNFLSSLAPFWTWARAATKFVFVTLPKDHPILTGLLAAASGMTRSEREKFGLDTSGPLPLPNFLQGSIPDPFGQTGSTLKLSNLTSYGFLADPLQSFGKIPAPQFSSAILGALGIDWTGKQLTNSDGSPADFMTKLKTVLLSTADGYIPFLNLARNTANHGLLGGVLPRSYPQGITDYLRNQQSQQQISVPIPGAPQLPDSGSSGGVWGGTSAPSDSGIWGGSSSSSGSVWAP